MRREEIVYIGWIGHDNMGDEALYRVSQEIFKPYRLVKNHFTHHSRITLFGGGTVFPEWPAFILPNRYNYAFGVGVRNPSFFGEFHPLLINRMKRFDFRFLGVRGHISQGILSGLGIESEIIGDPCLLLASEHSVKREETRIGINVGQTGNLLWGGDDERVLSETAKVCKALARKSYRPVLMPLCDADFPYLAEISENTNTEIFGEWRDLTKLLDFVRSCQVVVGEKLHSLVFSAATHTPFVSLEYRPKCREFIETMDFNDFNLRTDELTTDKIIGKLLDLLDSWDDMHELLQFKVRNYRQRLRGFADLIKEDIEALPDDKWSAPPMSFPRSIVYKMSFPRSLIYHYWHSLKTRVCDNDIQISHGTRDVKMGR